MKRKIIFNLILFIILISIQSVLNAANANIEINAPEEVYYGENFDVSLKVPDNTYGIEANVTIKYSNNTEESQKLVYLNGMFDTKNLITFKAKYGGNAQIVFSNIILCDENSNIIQSENTITKTIKIKRNLTGLNLNFQNIKIYINKQSTLQLTPILTPEDSTDLENIQWQSSDETIAIVNNNGLVTFKNPGTVSIKAICREYSATCNITVNDEIENTTLDVKQTNSNKSVIYVNSGIKNENFLVEENFPIMLTNSVKLYDLNGKEKNSSSKVASKDVLKIIDNNGNVLQEYTIIVPGDINSDGELKSYDAFTILKGTIFKTKLDEIDTLIRDYNGDGKVAMYDAFAFLKQTLFL